MSTHNICFYGELWKIIPKVSSDTPLICSTGYLKKIAVITQWLYRRVIHPKDADGMANSVDPVQIAPSGAVWRMSSLICGYTVFPDISEPRYDKTNKMSVHPAKTQISLGIRQV